MSRPYSQVREDVAAKLATEAERSASVRKFYGTGSDFERTVDWTMMWSLTGAVKAVYKGRWHNPRTLAAIDAARAAIAELSQAILDELREREGRS